MEILDDFVPQENEEQEDWSLFIQKNAESYIPKWKMFKNEGPKISINIAAVLGGAIWAAYRKMYLVFIVNTVLFFMMVDLGEWIVFVNLLFYLLFGDWLYFKHAQKKIAAINSKEYSASNRAIELHAKGGTSLLVPVLLLLLVVAVFITIFIFLISTPSL